MHCPVSPTALHSHMSCLHAVSAEDKGDILDVEAGIAVQITPGSGQL